MVALTGEMGFMRKNIEDLHISVNEKDAEIIKLRMHLGDEKAKANKRLRPVSSQNSLNQSTITSGKKVQDNSNLSARIQSRETSPVPPLRIPTNPDT